MKDKNSENVKRDVILGIVVCISILLFISNIGIGGIVGSAVSSFLFGMFGLTSYAFPFLFLLGTFFVIANKGNKVAAVKIVSAVLLLLFFCTLTDLIVHGELIAGPVSSFKASSSARTGGGFVGGLFGFLLFKGFGLIGAYVIDIAILIISVILILEKSALSVFEKLFKDASREKKVKKNIKKEKKKQEIEKKRIEEVKTEAKEASEDRRKLKVHGVTTDTVISGSAEEIAGSDETKEVTLHGEDIGDYSDNIEKIKLYPDGQDKEAEVTEVIKQEPKPKKTAAAKTPAKENIREITAPVEKEETPATVVPEKPVVNNQQTATSTTSSTSTDTGLNSGSNDHKTEYRFPPINLLSTAKGTNKTDAGKVVEDTKNKLQKTLADFGVNVTVTDCSVGPAVTRYEIQPEQGTKVSKIVNLADDIKLNLAAADIRIEAPIPGKPAVGIEVPNKSAAVVTFRELIEDPSFSASKSNLAFAVGKDIGGKVVIADIAKMPHVLIAGATGSGKSVCINTIIMSILYHAHPDDVKFIMIDPKVVELSVYNGIPHLLIPVVTDPKKAAGALQWAVKEMMERYDKFAATGVRQMSEYNKLIKDGKIEGEKLPQIVVIVDELADLMMVASKEVEDSICRIAQLARAAGIHLVIATQRPSVNVITGLIKANMPSRIAFAVTSGIDSRTILDMIGAEKLLGKGDMLYFPQGIPKPVRVQGAFVPDEDVHKVTEFIRDNSVASYDAKVQEAVKEVETAAERTAISSAASAPDDGNDPYFADAGRFIIEKEKASIGVLQRQFKIGFNRAARIMEQLSEAGVVGPEVGTKPREIKMTITEFEAMLSGDASEE